MTAAMKGLPDNREGLFHYRQHTGEWDGMQNRDQHEKLQLLIRTMLPEREMLRMHYVSQKVPRASRVLFSRRGGADV